jgi:L-malate glycosyltransferase
MHILFLPSWYPEQADDIGGSFFREQALALQALGVKVGVIAPSMRSIRSPVQSLMKSGKSRVENDEGIMTFRSSMLNLTPRLWTATAHRYVRMSRGLYDKYVQSEGQPDLVHVHAALFGGVAALDIQARYNVPFILSEHSTAFARGIVNEKGLNLVHRIATKAICRFAVSTPFARLLDHKLGLAAQPFSVMPNSVSHLFLDSNTSQFKQNYFRFFHVSTLDTKKNVSEIITAFASNFRDQPSVTLTIGGDGPERQALIALAVKLKVRNQILFPGRLSRREVRNTLAQSDAFVLSSKFETFGVVLIEALAMGVPVIATRCGGPEDIVSDDTGILVPVGDVAALGAAMVEMKQNCERWEPTRLREICKNKFGPEAVSKRWVEIYNNVLAQKS